jgi:predicted RNase H-like HicB family nuclease
MYSANMSLEIEDMRMPVRNFKVVLEEDSEAGGYVVRCPELQGCYSQGETVDEALENIRETIQLCIEDMKAQGEPIPGASEAFLTNVAVEI